MSDIKLKKLELRVKELEARIEALENMEEILVFQPSEEDYTVEFTPDPEFLKDLWYNMDAPVKDPGAPKLGKLGKLGQAAAESGGGPFTSAEIHHFPGLSDEDAKENTYSNLPREAASEEDIDGK